MERVLESIQQESADGDRLNERQERLKELLDQFERLPQHQKKVRATSFDYASSELSTQQ